MALACLTLPAARAAEITPFKTFNQSPIIQIYGLPAPEEARVLPAGHSKANLALDLASNFAHESIGSEKILLDGESLRTTLSLSRGFGSRFEAGIEIPVVNQSGGFLDGFIEGWHSFFHLPDGGRPDYPRNQLVYWYQDSSKAQPQRFNYTRSELGIGDLRVTGGMQLVQNENWALALRALVKLPTGDSSGLMGSGSTDTSWWLTGQRDWRFAGGTRTALFGQLGALAKTRGDVLPDQQRYLVGFGSLGAGWSPWERVAFKVQFSSHTPFYKDSELPELSGFSTLMVMGGTIAFSPNTALDIGVSEDVMVDRSPDVAFHLALTRKF
ncbi:DUF3187 family protein [Geomesophilobacter sediminis]|uniref:DUF3187 family protein n=1 Tax=Geomesophilobacter sediminis TaxID=2798584 RepID=A0A8J7LVK8_9BACT|nr:DUF3187 family protein [Geomesophilobacter sediminis]MBJ6725639.1 DUF3187 family protein [Geomesophilobacter sediminis]